MPTRRINRLVRLIVLLQAGQAGSPDELAQMLGVSRRTLFRDLNVLKDAGVPHFYEPGEGYRLGESYFLPPINLTITETLGLLLLGKQAAAARHQPMMGLALSAINKLIVSVPEPLRKACADVMSHVSIDPGGQVRSRREPTHYATLGRCIDEGRACRMTYRGPVESSPLICRLEPYALHFASRAWYVFGRTDVHDEVRMFKLARIVALEPLDDRFKPPKRFDPAQKMGKAWRMIPEGKVYRIELLFSPRVATNVEEVRWHDSQQTKRLADGRLRMTLEVDGLNEIAWWICGYADQVEVKKPKALRDRVKEMHKRAAE